MEIVCDVLAEQVAKRKVILGNGVTFDKFIRQNLIFQNDSVPHSQLTETLYLFGNQNVLVPTTTKNHLGCPGLLLSHPLVTMQCGDYD